MFGDINPIDCLSVRTHVISSKWRRFLVVVVIARSSLLTVKPIGWNAAAAFFLVFVVFLFWVPDSLVFLLIVVVSTLRFHDWLESSFLLVITLVLNSFIGLISSRLCCQSRCFQRGRRWMSLFALNLKSLSRPASSFKEVRLRIFWIASSIRRGSPRSWSPSELLFLMDRLVSIGKTTLISGRVKVWHVLLLLYCLLQLVLVDELVEPFVFVERGRALFEDRERLVERWRRSLDILFKLLRRSGLEARVSLNRHSIVGCQSGVGLLKPFLLIIT